MATVVFLLIAPVPAEAGPCVEYGVPKTCPAPPPPPAVNQCDWQCQEWKAQERERRRKEKALRDQTKANAKWRESERKRSEEHRKLVDRANSFVIKAQAAHAQGKYDLQLSLLRQALAVLPDDPTLKLNIIQHLAFHGRNSLWRDQQLDDHSRIEAHRNRAEELRRLLAEDLSQGIDHASKKAEAVSYLADLSYWEQQAEQSRRIAAELSRVGSSRQGYSQMNPGARGAQGAAAASLPPRRLPPPRNVSAFGQLQDILEGRASVGEALEGGQTITDPDRFRQSRVPGSHLSPEQRARLDASPAFRRSQEETARVEGEFARAAKELRGLKFIAAHARPGSAEVPSAADIQRAERKARENASKLEKAREKEREAINRVLAEPIYEDD